MTPTDWRNVISLSAVLNFLLPARGRWAPVLRSISSAQSSSSLCRTFLCFHRHIFNCRWAVAALGGCCGAETITDTLHMLLSIVKRWRFILFHSPVQYLYLLTLSFLFFLNDIPIIVNCACFKEQQTTAPWGSLTERWRASSCCWLIQTNVLQKCK